MNQTKYVRRQQVTTAVLKVIGKRGMGGLTTVALAREVGMSEANLYRHFESKQEILSQTVKRIEEGLRENITLALGSSSAPILRLKEAFQLHLHFVDTNKGIPRLVFSDETQADNTGLRPRLLAIISSYAGSLEEIIKQGKLNGTIRPSIDPRATALTFIGMLQVTILRWVLSDFSLSMKDEGSALWDNFEACIAA